MQQERPPCDHIVVHLEKPFCRCGTKRSFHVRSYEPARMVIECSVCKTEHVIVHPKHMIFIEVDAGGNEPTLEEFVSTNEHEPVLHNKAFTASDVELMKNLGWGIKIDES
jgi:hypothetical protein